MFSQYHISATETKLQRTVRQWLSREGWLDNPDNGMTVSPGNELVGEPDHLLQLYDLTIQKNSPARAQMNVSGFAPLVEEITGCAAVWCAKVASA
jgi:hypothetical protein